MTIHGIIRSGDVSFYIAMWHSNGKVDVALRYISRS